MAKAPVSIGPFIGGMNNVLDPSSIDDSQCVSIRNFDILENGNLRTRPPITYWSVSSIGSGVPYNDRRSDLGMRPANFLGFFTDTSLSRSYFIVSTHVGTAFHLVRKIPEDQIGTPPYSTIAGKYFSSAVQYNSQMYLVPAEGETYPGGRWSPTAGTTYGEIPDLPSGVSAVVYKERMFIADSSGKVRFSEPGDFTNWPASNFFNVSIGDGQKLVRLLIVSNQIVIFKTESTYTFGYDSSPSRATVQPVSTTIGADSHDCVAQYDNLLFVFHNGSVYVVTNWRWEKINKYVKFEINFPQFYEYVAEYDGWYPSFAPPPPDPPPVKSLASLSIVGDRLLVRYGRKYYSFYIPMQAWTEWEYPNNSGMGMSDVFHKAPENDERGVPQYFSTSYGYTSVEAPIFVFYDTFDNKPITLGSVPYDCSIVTKMYDFELPYAYKRLFWWGVDALTKTDLNVIVRPVAPPTQVTWGDVEALGKSWDTLKLESRVWSRPLDISIDVSDSASIQYAPGVRGFIKYIKSLRFRKITFEVSSSVSGFLEDSPVEIFSLIAFVADKQLVPKKVT